MQGSELSAVILAAGLSTRFGGHLKALHKLQGISFLERLANAFKQGGVGNIVVVTGHQAEDCRNLAEELNIKSVHNKNFTIGMFSSIQRGLKASREFFPNSSGVLLSPVDAALIMPRSVKAMLAAWKKQMATPQHNRIIIASFNGTPGHPALIPATHIEAILARDPSGAPSAAQEQNAPWGLRGYYASLSTDKNLTPTQFINFLHPEEDNGAQNCHSKKGLGSHACLQNPSMTQKADNSFQSAASPSPLAACPEQGVAGQAIIEIPLPDAGIISDLDEKSEANDAEKFLISTENRKLPSITEAWQLLCLSQLSGKKIRHSILVGQGSLRIGLRMAECGLPCNPLLLVGAGLLHDILRMDSDHAVSGAKLLHNLGWPKTAFVVGCHTRLPEPYLARLGIASNDTKFKSMEVPANIPHSLGEELFYSTLAVYMADKYARRDKLSTISERFHDIKEWFKANPDAIQGIAKREELVKKLEKKLSARLNCNLLELVGTVSTHPLETELKKTMDNYKLGLEEQRKLTQLKPLFPAG